MIQLVLKADMDIMSRTIYGEARGETYEGKLAVAHVILNRVERRHRGECRIAGVCTEPYQFSCWLPSDPNLRVIINVDARDRYFADSMRAAEEALKQHNSGTDPVKGSTMYHTVDAPSEASWPPDWVRGHKPVAQVGAHLFYNDVK